MTYSKISSVVSRNKREVSSLYVCLSVYSRSLSAPLMCATCKADTYSVCVCLSSVLYIYIYMMGGKKSRDKSRNEEHQKLSCKIFPLVFYFKANNMKMRGVAAITAPRRQGTPRHSPQNKRAMQCTVKSATTKKQMTTLPKTKELPNVVFLFFFLSTPLLGHKFKNFYIGLECTSYLNT